MRDWREVAAIPVAGQPVFVIARPDGRQVWVNFAFPTTRRVQVIDTESRTVVRTLEPGKAVLHLEFTPRGEAVWISARDDDRVVGVRHVHASTKPRRSTRRSRAASSSRAVPHAPGSDAVPDLSAAQRALLDRYQRDFPICAAPYAEIARALRMREDAVLAALRALVDRGIVARVAPIFRAGSVGASTLAAMAVPLPRLEDVARIVGAHAGVNHNYAREHRFNLWFVAHAADRAALAALLQTIEAQARLPAISLPLVREYHIDLGFPLDGSAARRLAPLPAKRTRVEDGEPRQVACALERGLPLVAHPYAEIAQQAGLHGRDGEARVCRYLRGFVADGIVKRIGIVVRHRPLGFAANPMAVWDDTRARHRSHRRTRWPSEPA